jgi:hypothetical protein
VAAPEFSDSTLVAHAVASYARAIASRDVSAIRRVYPAMTSQQQRSFEQFFGAANDLRVTFRVTDLSLSGSTADARVSGSYEWTSSRGAEQQPVSFIATLRKDAGTWRLLSVR